jgi:hypothetical protein
MVIGAAGVGWGGKEQLFDIAAKFDESIEALKYFKTVKVVSKGLFAAQIVVSGYQAGKAWTENNSNKWGVTWKSSIDILMAAAGTFGGPAGWLIAGTYFLLDATTDMNKWGEPSEN